MNQLKVQICKEIDREECLKLYNQYAKNADKKQY